MKYLDIESTVGPTSSPDLAPADPRNVVVLRLPAVGRVKVPEWPSIEALDADCRNLPVMLAAGDRETPAVETAAHVSAFRWIVQGFASAGETLALSHASFAAPAPASSRPEPTGDARGEGSAVAGCRDGGSQRDRPQAWIRRLFAAVREFYRSQLREAAIRSAVRDLERANDALLRDIGINHRTEIESFVRNGLAHWTAVPRDLGSR